MGKPLFVMRERKTLYGVWASNVLTVQPFASMTPLPKPLPYFEGISSYKGNMIPVFSLARMSGKQEERREPVMIIMEHERGIFGILASEVLYVTEDTDETMPYDSLKLDDGVLQISGIVRSEEPVFVLDIEKILEEVGK